MRADRDAGGAGRRAGAGLHGPTSPRCSPRPPPSARRWSGRRSTSAVLTTWRRRPVATRSVHLDDDAAGTFLRDTVPPPNHVRCVREERLKYATYVDPARRAASQHELYDLDRDPLELNNLVDRDTGAPRDPAYAADLERLRERVAAVPVPAFPENGGQRGDHRDVGSRARRQLEEAQRLRARELGVGHPQHGVVVGRAVPDLRLEPGLIVPSYEEFLNYVHPDDRPRSTSATGRPSPTTSRSRTSSASSGPTAARSTCAPRAKWFVTTTTSRCAWSASARTSRTTSACARPRSILPPPTPCASARGHQRRDRLAARPPPPCWTGGPSRPGAPGRDAGERQAHRRRLIIGAAASPPCAEQLGRLADVALWLHSLVAVSRRPAWPSACASRRSSSCRRPSPGKLATAYRHWALNVWPTAADRRMRALLGPRSRRRSCSRWARCGRHAVLAIAVIFVVAFAAGMAGPSATWSATSPSSTVMFIIGVAWPATPRRPDHVWLVASAGLGHAAEPGAVAAATAAARPARVGRGLRQHRGLRAPLRRRGRAAPRSGPDGARRRRPAREARRRPRDARPRRGHQLGLAAGGARPRRAARRGRGAAGRLRSARRPGRPAAARDRGGAGGAPLGGRRSARAALRPMRWS